MNNSTGTWIASLHWQLNLALIGTYGHLVGVIILNKELLNSKRPMVYFIGTQVSPEFQASWRGSQLSSLLFKVRPHGYTFNGSSEPLISLFRGLHLVQQMRHVFKIDHVLCHIQCTGTLDNTWLNKCDL